MMYRWCLPWKAGLTWISGNQHSYEKMVVVESFSQSPNGLGIFRKFSIKISLFPNKSQASHKDRGMAFFSPGRHVHVNPVTTWLITK
ncbi:hypothetical protein Nepgr_031041 [Nepenthes gracilis]|uniref:Uncharacterized protein n=1 Tax=Nepenthes gracilis TaxID=150966 RepID=A0AAD3THQ6_NEPGR|nr:hypothetical protein Nepgr_031041 [Nepenthes gracilis]